MTRIISTITLFAAYLAVAQANAGPVTDLNTRNEPLSYYFGTMMAEKYLIDTDMDVTDLDFSALKLGIEDRMDGTELRLSSGNGVNEALRSIHLSASWTTTKHTPEQARRIGTAFLERNAGRAGIITTDTGLQYRVMREGHGPQPTASETVGVQYTGRLLAGTVFDATNDPGQPVSFRVNDVIPGWEEVLQLMKVNSVFEVWLPSELANGPRGDGGTIGPNQVLNFTIVLYSIQ